MQPTCEPIGPAPLGWHVIVVVLAVVVLFMWTVRDAALRLAETPREFPARVGILLGRDFSPEADAAGNWRAWHVRVDCTRGWSWSVGSTVYCATHLSTEEIEALEACMELKPGVGMVPALR